MLKLLLLEDDFKLATEIIRFIKGQDLLCESVHDGDTFLSQVAATQYNLFILDINLPGLNGIEICRKIREQNATTPVLMLTAYSSVEDKVKAFDSGADDYLVKPFHPDELLARIKALLRRDSAALGVDDKIYRISDLVINTMDMKVTRAGREIGLTPKEYKLLVLLAKWRGKTISKQTMAEKVWDINFETGTNTIEVYISFLRNKIDKGFDNPLIHTQPGLGYYLKDTK